MNQLQMKIIKPRLEENLEAAGYEFVNLWVSGPWICNSVIPWVTNPCICLSLGHECVKCNSAEHEWVIP